MKVGDYAALWASETNFGQTQLPSRAHEWLGGIGSMVTATLKAVRDAPPVVARFPAIVYAPGFSNPSWENADLCEYLASQGYLVLATPSMGEKSRDMTLNVAGLSAQARDISFLVGYAASLANADSSRVGVVGFSWGGLANVFAAARDSRIGALVSLDGSLRFSPGLLQTVDDVYPEQMTIPLLSIVQGQWTPEDQAAYLEQNPSHAGPSVMNAWKHGDLVTLYMLGLSHMEHSSMYQRNEEVWWKLLNVWGQKKPDYGREDGIKGYGWMARYSLAFLNAYLKQDAAEMTFLRRPPGENGVPRHQMVKSFRKASGVPTSLEGFRTEVARLGFDRVAEVYERFRMRKAEFTLQEHELVSWSQDLQDSGAPSDAIAILRFNVQLHSESTEAYLSLGNAYRNFGQLDLAVEGYRRAFEKDPANADAMWRLREVGACG